MEERVRKERQQLEEKRRRIGWDLVKKAVLETAKAWKGKELATKAAKEEGEALEELNRKVVRMREAEAVRRGQIRRAEQEEMRSEQMEIMRRAEHEEMGRRIELEQMKRTEQEQMMRRAEKEGWARLDKVASEVERMERVVACRTIQQGGEMVMESERFSKQASGERSIGEEIAKGR